MSTELFTFLSCRDTLVHAIDIYWSNVALFTSLALLVYVPFLLQQLFIVEGHNISDPDDPSFDLDDALLFDAVWLGLVALQVTCAIIGHTGMIRAVADIYAQRSPEPILCIKTGFSLALDVFVCGFLTGTFLALPFVIILVLIQVDNMPYVLVLIVLAFAVLSITYAGLGLVMAVPIVVVEGCGPLQAIMRSWELAHDRRFYLLGPLAVLGAINTTLSLTISMVVSSFGDPAAAPIQREIMCSFPHLVFGPIFTVLHVVLYFSLRVHKEAFNLDILTHDLRTHSTNARPQYTKVADSDGCSTVDTRNDTEVDEELEIV